MSAPYFDGYVTWRWKVTSGSSVVAETTSLEAANAVERLYYMAYARGERPRYGIGTHVARWMTASGTLDYDGHATLAAPMTDAECEAWFSKVAGGWTGCAYCGGKHRSDRCPNVMQAEVR